MYGSLHLRRRRRFGTNLSIRKARQPHPIQGTLTASSKLGLQPHDRRDSTSERTKKNQVGKARKPGDYPLLEADRTSVCDESFTSLRGLYLKIQAHKDFEP